MENTEAEDRIERQLAAALKSEPETWTSDCLATEQMLALVERSLPEAQAALLMAHVALCARCRREYAETVELMQLAEEVNALQAQAEPPAVAVSQPSPARQSEPSVPAAAPRDMLRPSFWQRWFSPGLGFALGAAAAGIALFFAWTVPARVQRDRIASTLKAREAQVAHAEQAQKTLEQQLAALQQQSRGNASHLAQEVNRLNARVKAQGIQIARLSDAETTLQQMPLPTAEWKLSQESEQLRGEGEPTAHAPEIRLDSPVDTALQDTRPTLECRPVPGATEYRVSLETEGANEEIPTPKPLSATRWQVTTPLSPGKVYKWAVTAQRGNELLHSPFAKFYILSAAQSREIALARRQYTHNPLTLGILYARMGMPSEAAQQFQTVLKANPDQPVAKRWLGELQEQRR